MPRPPRRTGVMVSLLSALTCLGGCVPVQTVPPCRLSGDAATMPAVLPGDPHITWTGAATPQGVTADWPGTALWRVDHPWRGKRFDAAEVEVFLPFDAPPGLTFAFFAQDKDGLWFETDSEAPPRRGAWSALRFNVNCRAAAMRPAGHGAFWNRYYFERVARWGVAVFCPVAWEGGCVSFGPVRWRSDESARAAKPLRVVRLAPPPASSAPAAAWRVTEIAFDLDPSPANPCDPDEVAVDALIATPAGQVHRIPCFYDQPFERALDGKGEERLTPNGRAGWKLRYTPREAGTHRWRLVQAGDWEAGKAAEGSNDIPLTGERRLEVAAAPARGFVRVSGDDPRYFETADGAFFYPVGFNLHSPFDKRAAGVLKLPVSPNRGSFAYEAFFPKMAAAGMNATMVWMANWWASLEWSADWPGFGGLADYNLAHAWRLDRVFDAAARHNIQVMLNLGNHGQLSEGFDREWISNPYNAVNGGPCPRPADFFAAGKALRIYRKRLRYIVARWGAHPHLMGYQLMSEIDLSGNPGAPRHIPAKTGWCRRAALALKAMDMHGRPVGVQYSGDHTVPDPATIGQPELDCFAGDAYKWSGDTVSLHLSAAHLGAKYDKPYWTAEFGGQPHGAPDLSYMHADLHTALWVTAMTPAATSPMLWWHDFVDHFGHYGEYRALAKFVEGFDRRGGDWRTAVLPVRGADPEDPEGAGTPAFVEVARHLPTPAAPGRRSETGDPMQKLLRGTLSGLSLTNGARGLFWLFERAAMERMPALETAAAHEGVATVIPGLLPGRYRIEYWDTRAGEVVHAEEARAEPGGLRLNPPPFKIDLAGKIESLETPQDPLAEWLRANQRSVFSTGASE